MAIELNDPLAPSLPVSRRGFVALSAGAAFAIANGAAAGAQTVGFGKPHPPIVAENDPSITAAHITLTPSVGGPIGAYTAMPRTIMPGTPGVVVVQQIWGVDAQLRDVVRRFAKAGYIAIAPALFDRANPPSGDGATDFSVFGPIAAKMSADGFVPTDLAAARAWIRSNASRSALGIVGFCMGGGITLQSIVGTTDYKAASMMYGSVRVGTDPKAPTTAATFAFADTISTPLLGSFGARDTSIKAEDVEALFARLKAPHAVRIYDEAGHAFFDDTRERYIPSAAADAWTRTLSWFSTYLV